jgi:hypothetical protein
MGGLAPTSTGARPRASGGKLTATGDIIGGFATAEVEPKEEAIELARRFKQVHA